MNIKALYSSKQYQAILIFFSLTTISCTTKYFSPDILEMGHSKNNSYRSISHLSDGKSFSLEKILLPYNKKIHNILNGPLMYHNDKGDRILILLTNRSIISYNIDKRSISWEKSIPNDGNTSQSVPILNIKNKKIYFRTIHYKELSKKKTPKREITHYIVQIDLDGKNMKSFYIDIASLFPEQLQISAKERISCKTALSLLQTEDSNLLYLGCGMGFVRTHNFLYGENQGLSGLVISFLLDDHGDIIPPSPYRAFKTSKPTKSKNYGYDSGIYLLGGNFPILPDTSLLIGTGNGPVDFDKENFGCSVLNLDKNLNIVKNANETPKVFTLYDNVSGECWSRNDEYSSSTITYEELNGKIIAVAMGKHGNITFFDTQKMDQKNIYKITFRQKNNRARYGNIPVWKTNNKKLRFYFFVPPSFRTEATLLTKELLSQYRVLKKNCYGFVSREEEGREVALYYSGDRRKDYIVVVEGTRAAKELNSSFSPLFGKTNYRAFAKNFIARYKKINTLGHLIPSKNQNTFSSPELSKEFSFVPWMKDVQYSKYRSSKINNIPISDTNQGFFKYKGQNTEECPSLKQESLMPLYHTTIYPPEKLYPILEAPPEAFVIAVDIDQDFSVSTAWTYKLPFNRTFALSHAVLSTNVQNENPILIVATEDIATKGKKTSLVFIDGETGNKKEELNAIDGRISSYSMPVLFDEYLLVATSKGLLSYKINTQ